VGDQYDLCANNGSLPLITDTDGYIGCSGRVPGTAEFNVTWSIQAPDPYTYYDLQMSWVWLNIGDGYIWIYDGNTCIDTQTGGSDPPPSTVYTCYTGIFYVVLKWNVLASDPPPVNYPNYSFQLYYTWYDPYVYDAPRVASGVTDPVPPPRENRGNKVVSCMDSKEIFVKGIPIGRFGCHAWAPEVTVTWFVDTEFGDVDYTALRDMSTWKFPEYVVTAYSGLEVDKSKIIKPDKDGFGFTKGSQFTIVFSSKKKDLDQAPVEDKRINPNPPAPGFMGWFSRYRKGDKLPGYCPTAFNHPQ